MKYHQFSERMASIAESLSAEAKAPRGNTSGISLTSQNATNQTPIDFANQAPIEVAKCDKLDESNCDMEEYAASLASFITDIAVPDDRLFNIYASASTVIEDTSKICPDLSLSRPETAQFSGEIQRDIQTAPPLKLSQLQRDSVTWPSTNAEMDAFWLEGVQGERELDSPASLPIGLSIEEESLVKHFGSFQDPLLLISLYPIKDPLSTVHLRYGINNSLSNICMWTICAKLGFHLPSIRSSGMLHIKVFPRRID